MQKAATPIFNAYDEMPAYDDIDMLCARRANIASELTTHPRPRSGTICTTGTLRFSSMPARAVGLADCRDITMKFLAIFGMTSRR